MKRVFLLITIFLIASCTTVHRYKEPEKQDTFIEFSMDKDDGNQFYYIYPTASCEHSEGHGLAANMLKTFTLGGKPKTKSVNAGETIHILGVSIKRYDLGIINRTITCGKFAEITPEKGRTYGVSFNADTQGCEMSAVNKATSTSPQSFTLKPIPQSCSVHFK